MDWTSIRRMLFGSDEEEKDKVPPVTRSAGHTFRETPHPKVSPLLSDPSMWGGGYSKPKLDSSQLGRRKRGRA